MRLLLGVGLAVFWAGGLRAEALPPGVVVTHGFCAAEVVPDQLLIDVNFSSKSQDPALAAADIGRVAASFRAQLSKLALPDFSLQQNGAVDRFDPRATTASANFIVATSRPDALAVITLIAKAVGAGSVWPRSQGMSDTAQRAFRERCAGPAREDAETEAQIAAATLCAALGTRHNVKENINAVMPGNSQPIYLSELRGARDSMFNRLAAFWPIGGSTAIYEATAEYQLIPLGATCTAH